MPGQDGVESLQARITPGTQPSRLTARGGAVLLSLSLLTLAGCGNKVADATDDQLTALFADRMQFSRTETEEPRITRRTLECVRLIGGLDNAIYKDAPAEMIGALRTDCRRSLQERLNDTARNPIGATLADLEAAKAGERITAVHGRLEQAYRTGRGGPTGGPARGAGAQGAGSPRQDGSRLRGTPSGRAGERGTGGGRHGGDHSCLHRE